MTKITYTDKLLFTKHLSIMLKSGISISEALDTLIDESNNKNYRAIVKEISADVTNGHNLTESLAKHPDVFDPFYINLVKVGETSGTLQENLEYLTHQLEKDHDFRQKVISASLYPSIVLLAVVIIGGGVSFFVLPKLIDLFSSFDVILPLTTKILLWFANIMRDSGVFIFGGLVLIFILIKLILRIKPIKFLYDKLILFLPLIGPFNKSVNLTTICRSIGIMLKSGLTLPQALLDTAKGTQNLVYKKDLEEFLRRIDNGSSLTKAIMDINNSSFPKIAMKMIAVGEKTGTLDETLLYLGDHFEKEVDTTMKNLTTVMEPLLILIIGLVVGFVALAIITPIYQFTGSVK